MLGRVILNSSRCVAGRSNLPCVKYLGMQNFSTVKPFSRKRNNSEDSVPKFNFQVSARQIIEVVRAGIEPLQELNDDFDVVFSPERLEVRLGERGVYILHIDYEVKRVILQSPVSGMIQYYFNLENEAWLSEHDDHDLKGLIVRDMLRQQLIGCPSF